MRSREPIAVWLETIRASHSNGLQAELDRWALIQSVEDPATPAMLRATAALLLRARLNRLERWRIAKAAEATAIVELAATLRLILGQHATEAEVLSAIDQAWPSLQSAVRRETSVSAAL